MSFNVQYQTTADNFTNWPGGTFPLLLIRGDVYTCPVAVCELYIKAVPAIPSTVTSLTLPLNLFRPYGVSNDYQFFNQEQTEVVFAFSVVSGSDVIFGFSSGTSTGIAAITAQTNVLAAFANLSGDVKVPDVAVSVPQRLDVSTVGGVGDQRVANFSTNATSNRAQLAVINDGGLSHSAAILLGRAVSSNAEWNLYTDSSANGSDNFNIHKRAGAVQGIAFIIDTNGKVSAPFGLLSPSLTISDSASNPGGSNTLWMSGGLPRIGSGNVLVDPSPTSANTIPVYTGTAGQVDTLSTTTAASLGRPISISMPVGSSGNPISSINVAAGRPLATILNINSAASGHKAGVQIGGNSQAQRWTMGNDWAQNNSDDFFIRRDDSPAVYAFQAESNGRVTLPIGALSPYLDLIGVAGSPSPSNPGGTGCIWYNLSDDSDRPQFGNNGSLALLSDVTSAAVPEGLSAFYTINDTDWVNATPTASSWNLLFEGTRLISGGNTFLTVTVRLDSGTLGALVKSNNNSKITANILVPADFQPQRTIRASINLLVDEAGVLVMRPVTVVLEQTTLSLEYAPSWPNCQFIANQIQFTYLERQ